MTLLELLRSACAIDYQRVAAAKVLFRCVNFFVQTQANIRKDTMKNSPMCRDWRTWHTRRSAEDPIQCVPGRPKTSDVTMNRKQTFSGAAHFQT